MKEFAVRNPGGHFITFAQQVAAPQHWRASCHRAAFNCR